MFGQMMGYVVHRSSFRVHVSKIPVILVPWLLPKTVWEIYKGFDTRNVVGQALHLKCAVFSVVVVKRCHGPGSS